MNKFVSMLSFVRVVEHGGFTGAADSMGMTVSAVTKNVRKLETDLGAQLLLRTTRKLGVTEFGREYFSTCRRVLDELDSVENSLHRSQQEPRGGLHMQCPTFFARMHLLPRLGEFRRRHPQIELHISTGTSHDNIIDAGIDLAVVIGELHNSQFSARTLVRGPRVCCASPAYLSAHGTPLTPDELCSHHCIIGRNSNWKFKVGKHTVEPIIKPDLVVPGGDTLRQAVLMGYGLAQSNLWLFRNDLADGALVEVLRPYRVPGNPISVVYAPTRFLPRKLRVMIDFLVEITRGGSEEG